MKKLLILLLILIPNITFASWAPLKKNTTPEIQEVINYAWHISQDPAWILTLERESGFYPDAISQSNADGSRDYYICQLNSRYHWEFIKTKPNWKQQLHYCAEVYSRSGGKSFYGYFVRNTVKNRFIFFNN